MLFLKTDPIGIDAEIQPLQQYLHAQLLTKWGLQSADYQAYGRCYRNQKQDGYIPEVFVGGKEYKEVLLDDRLAVLSFFGMGENTGIDAVNTSNVHLIFFVNISRLKNLAHRADEEIRNDVLSLLPKGFLGFVPTGLVTGIANVFNEYSGWRNTNNIQNRDMHPFHCFRINTNIQYELSNCSFSIN